MLPKMILFDYGQTLFNQDPYQALNGYEALMKHITKNPHNMDASALTALGEKIYKQCSDVFGYKKKRDWHVEIPQKQMIHYIMEYYGLEADCSEEELSRIYWDGACSGTPVEGTNEMLEGLYNIGIRTGVISNLSFSGAALKERLDRVLPNNHFEMILSSTDVIFRKPEPAIFELAIAKSGLLAEEIWYVGDDTIWDVEAAYEVGITPVWFRGALDYQQPIPTVDHIMVNDWGEFMDLISRMARVSRE